MDEKDELRRFSSRYKTEKIKSRNLSEKKRRDQFNMLINELCSMVTSSSRKMDKSSVLRATISFLRNHNELSLQSQSVKVQENWKPSFLSNEEFTHLMLEALDGFIIVFSCNGQILYTSETTASLLGYLPSRIYSSVFDIIHEVDKSSLYKLINNAPSTSNNSLSKDSFMKILLHMKRGPIHSQGPNTYELVQLLGTFYHWPSSYDGPSPSAFDCDSNSNSSLSSMATGTGGLEMRSCFVAVGRLQTPHLLRVVNLTDDAKNEFTSRHSLEWKFLFLDHRAPPIIGYLPFEVLGTSGYDYYHVEDLDKIASSHELLMQTGEGTSCFYRFLTKGQQWIWLQTRYYISYHQWNSKPEFIVCTHTVVSTEKVLKSLQEAPRRISKNPSPPNMIHASVPSQSACFSPSPSGSSLGSLSSEQSEHCSTKVQRHVAFDSALKSLLPVLQVLDPVHHVGFDIPSNVSCTSQIPSLFTESHKPLEPLSSSTSTRVSTARYSGKRNTEMVSPVPRTLPPRHHMLAENFAESQHVISNVQSTPSVSSDINATIPSEHANMTQDRSANQISNESGQLISPMPSQLQNPAQQYHNERTPPAMNQAQVQEYLRHRHQTLQQQIRLQQEELRRVSEQLMYVQFASPPSDQLNISSSYQSSDMIAMPTYSSSYSNAPQPSMHIPISEENDVIKGLDGYTRITHISAGSSRTYMNLEPNMCNSVTSNMLLNLPSEQSDGPLNQSYSISHSLPPNS